MIPTYSTTVLYDYQLLASTFLASSYCSCLMLVGCNLLLHLLAACYLIIAAVVVTIMWQLATNAVVCMQVAGNLLH